MTPKEIKEVLSRHALWVAGRGGTRADLKGANLESADLKGANLESADLRNANLRNADLRNANLRNADLKGANLESADLESADLRNADLPLFQLCPQEGTFIAYKKVAGGTVLRLEILGRRTSSLVGRKCRAESVRVLGVVGSADPNTTSYYSKHNRAFEYKIGAVVSEPRYSDDIRVECVAGIHFFMVAEEAEGY